MPPCWPAAGGGDGGRAGTQAALRAFWLDVASKQSPWHGGCFGGGVGASPGLAAYNLDHHPFDAWQRQFLRLPHGVEIEGNLIRFPKCHGYHCSCSVLGT